MKEKIKQMLIDVVGDKNFTDHQIDMISYSYDASEHRHRPICGLRVETTQQISEILKIANKERIPVTPEGRGDRSVRHGGSHKGRNCPGPQSHE